MTELLLVRHGETDWNREGRYQGQTDVPLNATGLAQAEALAESQRGRPLDWVYASDMQRARQTAEILGRVTGAPVHIDRRLREIHLGAWEGQLFNQIQETQGDLLAQRDREPLDNRPPGGESVREVMARALPLLEEIQRRHPDGRVAIVSHGAALAVIKIHVLDLPVEAVWDHVPRNGSVEEISLEAP